MGQKVRGSKRQRENDMLMGRVTGMGIGTGIGNGMGSNERLEGGTWMLCCN